MGNHGEVCFKGRSGQCLGSYMGDAAVTTSGLSHRKTNLSVGYMLWSSQICVEMDA